MIDTTDLAVARRWGLLDALFVDEVPVRTGPPASYARIHALIARRVKRLARAAPAPAG